MNEKTIDRTDALLFPQVEQATQNAASNPYGAQAIGGSQTAADYATGSLAPLLGNYAAGALNAANSPQLAQYGQVSWVRSEEAERFHETLSFVRA